MESTIIQLVERFRGGDQDAARVLFDHYVAGMLALVRRLVLSTANRAAFDSEGAVNEGFRSFFSEIKKPIFDPRRRNIGGLLATIVAPKALVKLRRKYPLTCSPTDMEAYAEATSALLDASLTEQEVVTDLHEKIARRVMADLTERERSIVQLFLDDEDLSIAGLADKSRRSLVTVEDVIDRFIARLEGLVGPGEERT